MRNELEPAFRCRMPDAYKLIVTRLEAMRSRMARLRARGGADRPIRQAGHQVEVKGRQSSPIWRKMERRRSPSSNCPISMAFAFVDTASTVTPSASPIRPGLLGASDHISTPKQNDYRSIHTTVIGPGSQRVELQILHTRRCTVAEYGIAGVYKDRAQRRRGWR